MCAPTKYSQNTIQPDQLHVLLPQIEFHGVPTTPVFELAAQTQTRVEALRPAVAAVSIADLRNEFGQGSYEACQGHVHMPQALKSPGGKRGSLGKSNSRCLLERRVGLSQLGTQSGRRRQSNNIQLQSHAAYARVGCSSFGLRRFL